MRYRRAGEPAWHSGVTENMSRSGVLFRSDGAIDVNAEITMNFLLPVETLGRAGGEVRCHGRAVRVVEHPGEPPALSVAATISDYHFVRARPVSNM